MTSLGKKFEEAIKTYIENGDNNILHSTFLDGFRRLSESGNDQVLDIDDSLFFNTIKLAIERNQTPKQVNLSYLHIKKAINTDKMIESLEKQKPKFGGHIVENNAPICYLDQNVFTGFIHGESIGYSIPEGYIIPYSPAHILEIGQTRDKEIIKEELELTGVKTKNKEILFCDNKMVMFIEDPLYCYKRTYDGTDDINLAKEDKIINNEIEKIRFGKYRTDKLREIYNSQDPDHFLINHRETVDEILGQLTGYDLSYFEKNIDSNVYTELNSAIIDLFRVMDICGFKKDNDDHKIRSSRIDIEHLLYASNCSLFLTKDKKLRVRARNIYEILGKKIEIPDF